MVIISSILERDEAHGDIIWNTAGKDAIDFWNLTRQNAKCNYHRGKKDLRMCVCAQW